MRFFEGVIGQAEPNSMLLDLGCGNGYSVLEWRRKGLLAFGVDLSFYRLSRWPEVHAECRPLVIADASALPFRDGVFDVSVSSGMLEHVGVEEASNPYRIRALPNRDELRELVVREMLRVAASDGEVVVDFPNGTFPVDFWHGDEIGSFRIHRIPDVLLPSYRDVARWSRGVGAKIRLRSLVGRFQFRQVGRRWWGRLLEPLMRAYLRALDSLTRFGLGSVAGLLAPYLVIEINQGVGASTGASRSHGPTPENPRIEPTR